MSRRAEGWYWVMVLEDSWEPAYFDGQHFTLDHGPVARVGPRIPEPNEAPPIGQRYRNDAGEVVAVVAPAVLDDAMMHSAAGYDQRTMRATWHGLYDAMLTALPEPE